MRAVQEGDTESAAVAVPSSTVKRKMAFTVSYCGSNYYGLQMDINTADVYPTVEDPIERALYELGCIAESNKRALSKIGWSRSSRTDKGVHCARVVISAKLEMQPTWLHDGGVRAPEVVQALNRKLPDDIRVMSLCKINQGFRAKEACSWREYEYLLPPEMLFSTADGEQEVEEVMRRFSACLKKMEGTHSFHNFHRLSAKALKGRNFKTADDEEAAAEEDVDGEVGAEAEVATGSGAAVVAETPTSQALAQALGAKQPLHDTWTPRPRDMTEMTRGIIFAFETIDRADDPDAPFVRLRVRGQSFLLHQIRLMVACAVLVARDILPEDALDMALLSPHFINLPLAPAEGLVLINAGFDRNSNGHSVAMSHPGAADTDTATDADADAALARPDDQGGGNDDGTFYLMTRREYEASEAFKEGTIYPRMAGDWAGTDARTGLPLVQSWLQHAERFRASPAVRAAWAEQARRHREDAEAEYQQRRHKETQRLLFNVAQFRETYMAEGAGVVTGVGTGVGTGDEAPLADCPAPAPAPAPKKKKLQAYPHKKLLPNSISTALINRFRCYPGDAVLQVQAFYNRRP